MGPRPYTVGEGVVTKYIALSAGNFLGGFCVPTVSVVMCGSGMSTAGGILRAALGPRVLGRKKDLRVP